jgi:hypothetical protein
MSMSLAMKSISGTAKNNSMSQIWISCGIRDPLLSKVGTPRQIIPSKRIDAKNNIRRRAKGKHESNADTDERELLANVRDDWGLGGSWGR